MFCLLLSSSFMSFFQFCFYLLLFLFNGSHFFSKCNNFWIFIPYFFKIDFKNSSVKWLFLLSPFIKYFKINSSCIKFLIRLLSINWNIFLLLKHDSKLWILSDLTHFPFSKSIKIFIKRILFNWLKTTVLSYISIMILIHYRF